MKTSIKKNAAATKSKDRIFESAKKLFAGKGFREDSSYLYMRNYMGKTK